MTGAYKITEPHPSVPRSAYMTAGRGGAGNITHVNAKDLTAGATASGPASLRPIKPHSSDAYFAAGRGGAGNLHRERERAIFSFDEELERQRKMMEHQAPIFYGRGGQGNLVHEERRGSSHSDASADTASTRSDGVRHSMEAAWDRVRSSFQR
ncbi:hypothetical protein EJ06DRAFT_478254 [Trichodelitschia bisporula]|uniref:Uncharacterized protein n=1 Tax=Trichodelitschia bisporula TaxID=703511 RepID=A0A6G1HUS4_9PEZI|nr:hypothetical protein EJ06DRAFT_478254 [Trichodelitschia bisporula]